MNSMEYMVSPGEYKVVYTRFLSPRVSRTHSQAVTTITANQYLAKHCHVYK